MLRRNDKLSCDAVADFITAAAPHGVRRRAGQPEHGHGTPTLLRPCPRNKVAIICILNCICRLVFFRARYGVQATPATLIPNPPPIFLSLFPRPPPPIFFISLFPNASLSHQRVPPPPTAGWIRGKDRRRFRHVCTTTVTAAPLPPTPPSPPAFNFFAMSEMLMEHYCDVLNGLVKVLKPPICFTALLYICLYPVVLRPRTSTIASPLRQPFSL